MKTTRKILAALATAAVSGLCLASGCGPNRYLTVTDYDQHCVNDTDCVAVAMGNACTGCTADAAINKNDFPKWQADRAELDCDDFLGDCAPINKFPFCRAGHCDLKNDADGGF